MSGSVVEMIMILTHYQSIVLFELANKFDFWFRHKFYILFALMEWKILLLVCARVLFLKF